MRKMAALAALLLALTAGISRAEAVVLLIDRASPSDQAMSQLLEQKLKVGGKIRRVEFDAALIANPISKGRILATLQTAGLVITIGDQASAFAARELDDTRIYFIGATLAKGADLKSSEVSGIFAYSPEDVLDALPASLKSGVGLLFTPGYEPVAKRIEDAAKGKGVAVQQKVVTNLKGLSSATEQLLGSAKTIWVLGDPLLVSEAGFSYLVEETLGRNIALIGPGAAQVREGALLCSGIGTPDAVAQTAADALRPMIESKDYKQPEARTAPPGGDVFYQPALGRKFGLTPQPQWKKID